MHFQQNRIPQQAVILFTRYPQAGKVKTRLIDQLGPQGAATLHDLLTKQVISNIEPVLQTDQTQLQVWYCGGSEKNVVGWLGKDIHLSQQQGDNLGTRMQYAFEQAWEQGIKRVLLIGSDCPTITASIINQGLEHLCTHDLVLGPAMDGGYYLVGLRDNVQRHELLFKNIDWGTGQVLQQTLHQAEQAGLSSTLLPTLHDVDRPEDLVHFNHYSGME